MARAQSEALISAKAAREVKNVTRNNPLYPLRCAKRDHEEPFIRRLRRPQGDGYSFVVAEDDGPGRPGSPILAAVCTGKLRLRNSSAFGNSLRLRSPK